MAPSDALFYRMLYPRQTLLVTSHYDGKSNVNAVDWAMPVSIKPPMVAISINKRGLTADLISASKEFVVAIPPESMKDIVANCAKTSGKLIDKLQEFNIPVSKAKQTDAPLIAGAVSQMECKLVQMFDAGEHEIVVGEVVETYFHDDEKTAPAPVFNKGKGGYFGFQKEWLDAKPPEKADDKKEEKKPDEKKGEEKKADEKKPEEKRGEDKKADENK